MLNKHYFFHNIQMLTFNAAYRLNKFILTLLFIFLGAISIITIIGPLLIAVVIIIFWSRPLFPCEVKNIIMRSRSIEDLNHNVLVTNFCVSTLKFCDENDRDYYVMRKMEELAENKEREINILRKLEPDESQIFHSRMFFILRDLKTMSLYSHKFDFDKVANFLAERNWTSAADVIRKTFLLPQQVKNGVKHQPVEGLSKGYEYEEKLFARWRQESPLLPFEGKPQ